MGTRRSPTYPDRPSKGAARKRAPRREPKEAPRDPIAGRAFITDLGFDPQDVVPTEAGDLRRLARYAAWLPVPGHRHHQPVEVGDDVGALQAKYGVPDGLVLLVTAPSAEAGSSAPREG